jgi:hypothetical protein
LDPTTNTCVETIVKLTPTNPQARTAAQPAINVVQGGTGLLFNLQTQEGGNTATRRQVLSVDKTGLMIGYDPLPANIGVNLTGAAKNLIYGVARAVGLGDDDSLLKLQVVPVGGGDPETKFRVDGSGNVRAEGLVKGSQLCIGADCKSSWAAVAPAGVLLQNVTPGTQQTGHFNVSGTGRVGALNVSGTGTLGSLIIGSGGTVNVQGAAITKANQISAGATGSTLPFLAFSDGDLVFNPTTSGGKGLTVWHWKADPTIVGYAKIWHNGVSAFIGDTTSAESSALKITNGDLGVPGEVNATSGAFGSLALSNALDVGGGIQAGSGNVNIINSAGKIPALSSTYLADLSGANLTNLSASNLSTGTVADARLPTNLVRTTYDAGVSNPGPWVTLQGGASVLGNIALRLYDAGTAADNVNILQFAHNGGSGPVLGAKIRSTSVGANMSGGAMLTLETTSNDAETINTNQLVLDRDGNIGVGVADPTVRLDVSGDVTATGDFTGKNTYECANVGTELRCTLRQDWRTADKQSGFVMSWVGSDTCTSVCTRAGLKVCSDIQFNWECPNGNLMQSWQDDDPTEFNPSERTCSSSTAYRASSATGSACSGQSGSSRLRFRCRCQG